ncbi:hypothetical protein C9I57_14480 [Trinickia symbiotica]|uniref:Uncharacterized protein n=1 Tax=Trinickia symbiotica TaxID=863227 RepID=A0A2T3XUY7_9BURK|nr:hypothetical protein C9I57_14480 [Trinickia symbiotica]
MCAAGALAVARPRRPPRGNVARDNVVMRLASLGERIATAPQRDRARRGPSLAMRAERQF